VLTFSVEGREEADITVSRRILSSSQSCIKPMYDLLGTPDEHKNLKLYDTDHIPPKNEFIRDILAWPDCYLGPVNR
jgi:hypothetical protein